MIFWFQLLGPLDSLTGKPPDCSNLAASTYANVQHPTHLCGTPSQVPAGWSILGHVGLKDARFSDRWSYARGSIADRSRDSTSPGRPTEQSVKSTCAMERPPPRTRSRLDCLRCAYGLAWRSLSCG